MGFGGEVAGKGVPELHPQAGFGCTWVGAAPPSLPPHFQRNKGGGRKGCNPQPRLGGAYFFDYVADEFFGVAEEHEGLVHGV